MRHLEILFEPFTEIETVGNGVHGVGIAQIRRVPENPEGDGVVLGNRKAIQIQVAHAHHGAVVTGQRERLKVAQRRFVVSGPQRCPPGVEILRGGRRRHKNGGRNEKGNEECSHNGPWNFPPLRRARLRNSAAVRGPWVTKFGRPASAYSNLSRPM